MSLPQRLAARAGVLGERDFGLFYGGFLASLIGTQMTPVALSFALLGQGRGAGGVSAVLAAESAPMVLLLLVGGVVADRLGRRRVMFAADLLRLGAQGAMAGWLLAGHPPLGAFLALEALVGAGNAFFSPALLGLVSQLASPNRLPQANALTGLAQSAGTVLGPALAGILVAVTNPGWAIAADAASYAISAGCLAGLRQIPPPPGGTAPFGRQLRDGWREFHSRTWLWVVVAQFALFHLLLLAPTLVLGAVISAQRLGGAGAWGAILACLGIGSVLGALLMLRLRPRRPLRLAVLGAALSALVPLLLATQLPTAAVAASALLAGVGLGVFGPLWDTTLQREIPAELLSRVSAYDWFGSVCFLPLGFVLVGPLTGLLGQSGVLLLAGGSWLALSAAVLAVPAVHRLAAPART